MKNYVDEFDAEDQIDAEEWIASMIYDLRGHATTPCEADSICEESARTLGREILLEILTRFRFDLVTDQK
jgi:hypothetical protein